ncbi:MAG: hypothetical protein IJW70_07155 [Clostridia bacterium]|nr:hypothetical protein [Clostridia bacterium]
MDQKQIKRNRNYFTKTDTLLYVGIGLVVVGAILFFFGYGYFSYIAASVTAPVGIVLLLIGASQRVTDADIDTCIAKLTEGMAVDMVENPKFARRILKQVPILQVQNYVYDDAILHKYAKSGSVRSEKFESAILYALDTELYVVRRRISLLSEQEPQNEILVLPYTDLQIPKIMEESTKLTFGKKTRTVSYSLLCLRTSDTELQLPMQSNADVDEFISRISRVLADVKKA